MVELFRNKSKRQIKKVLIKSGMDTKEANDIIKSSGKYGKIFNTPCPDIALDGFVFIDPQGDGEVMSKLVCLAKNYGRHEDVFVLDFSKGKRGSLEPETDEFENPNK